MTITHEPDKPAKKRLDKKLPDEKARLEAMIDAQMAQSFPASDPPAFTGASRMLGAPDRKNVRTVRRP